MRSLAVLVTTFLASLVVTQDTSLEDVKQAFDDVNIPEDLTLPFDPTVLLEVTFPQVSGEPIAISAGDQLPRNATAGPPTFAISGSAPTTGLFVIAAVDPDAPTPQAPTNAQIRHFLGGDFTLGADGALTNSTAAISPWRQPTPPAGSDAHRYIILLFDQPPDFAEQTVVTPDTPVNLFNLSTFVEQVGLGDPLGGTFLLVAPDPTA